MTIAVGVYYNMAAYQENRLFFWTTVGTRACAALIFWNQPGWRHIALLDSGSAFVTALTLLSSR